MIFQTKPYWAKCLLILLSIPFVACQHDDDGGAEPVDTSSAEMNFKLDTLATGLSNPWGMVFLDDTRMLINERSGGMHLFDGERLESRSIGGLPDISSGGQGGLLDIVKHPDYDNNGWLYFTYSKDVPGGRTTALARAKYSSNRLNELEELFAADAAQLSGTHFGSRIAFDHDGYVYFSIGDRGQAQESQSLENHIGTIVRLNDDGSLPSDNPFVDSAGAKPEIWSYGHRNPQGLNTHPATGELWSHEHGPQGGDELNLIKKGQNYGWPLVSHGDNYDGSPVGDGDTAKEGTIQPRAHWTPAIAPCGMEILHESNFEPWNGNFMIGSLVAQHLRRLDVQNQSVVNQEELLKDMARFRDVKQGPDGNIYILTESPGLLLKMSPED